MKGLVFTFNRSRRRNRNNIRSTGVDFKYIFRRYGSLIFFTLMLIVGLTVGSVMCGKVSDETISRLDFFFITNITQRINNGAVGAFCAGFASNFLFLFVAFIMGFSLWGVAFLPIVVLFKGFGIGISAGYLFMNFGIKGFLFYLSVLLPGIFLFSMSLIYQSSASYNIFKKLFKVLFFKREYSFSAPAKIYLLQSFRYLLVTLFSAVLDMVLWCVLAGLFKFS